MTNPHGTPIWYELLSNDADASKAFYEKVIGWTVHPADPGGMDYRMIDTGGGDFVGGLMNLTPEMHAGGAKPRWLFYIGVDDVDATVAKITEKGGGVLMPAIDMPGVGRMAFVHDPQGIPFYVMRGASPEDSTAYDRTGMGKCNWNELATPDQAAANAFYGEIFGWTFPDRMTMPGDMGDYVFVHVAGQQIGATMKAVPGGPSGWQFYFRTPDIPATAASVAEAGGTVHHGPAEVPGGDRIIIASDPHGIMFGAVGPGEAAAQ
ncbi:VOC family protein [Sphingomonas sp. GB1N7]|uniref:VOC family protein n=1 Tax=Parasphingomonas caseinilytica TaxID=3096158 RepID=UPI002FC9BE2E